jgi:hypothetical protein
MLALNSARDASTDGAGTPGLGPGLPQHRVDLRALFLAHESLLLP